ncbi:hypothetical protein NW841_12340 [Synechococcus sp. H60.3]|uniref:hypothetical protein n=1 Tax=Synechococcus sp. H60.3 TaxID=2967124 RepID=UPI0039C0380A
MTARDPKTNLRSSLLSLLLTSSLVGGVTSCSFSEAPSVTQVPPTLSAQAPETPVAPPESISFYYDGVKTSITIKDAAILFAASTQNTSDASKIVNFVNNTLKAGPITAADVTALGDPLKPAISDFTGDGVVNINDVAVLFAIASTGLPPTASKVNTFLSGTLKLGVTVTQAQLDSFFSAATPTPTPTPTPAPSIVVSPTSIPNATASAVKVINVKLAQDPGGIKTVTVTGPTGWNISPTSLTFDSSNFNVNQPVQFTAPLTAVGQTQNITFSGPGLGSVDVPVTVTPVPNTFFLDPVNGSDANPGTAAAPWKTFEGVLKVGVDPYQSKLVPLLQQGENVTIQIVAPAPVTQKLTGSLTTTVPGNGSITIVGPAAYKLEIPSGNTLTLDQNVKLEGFSIKVSNSNGLKLNAASAAVINAAITCDLSAGVCIEVDAANVKLSGNKITFLAAKTGSTIAIQVNNSNVVIKDSQFTSTDVGNATKDTLAIQVTASGTNAAILNSKFDLSSVQKANLAASINLAAGANNATIKGNKIIVSGITNGVGIRVVSAGNIVQDNEIRATANGVGKGIFIGGGASILNDPLNGNSFPEPPALNFKVFP